jgi:hypothetical protein
MTAINKPLEALRELLSEWRELCQSCMQQARDSDLGAVKLVHELKAALYRELAGRVAALLPALAEEQTKANDEIRRLRMLCSKLELQRQLLIDRKNTEGRGQ